QITGSQGLDTIELAKGINMDRINLIGYTPAGSAQPATTATATAAFTGVAGGTAAVTKTLTFTADGVSVSVEVKALTGQTINATSIGDIVAAVLDGKTYTPPAATAGTVTVTVGGSTYNPATGGTDLLTGWTASQAGGTLKFTPDSATTTMTGGEIKFKLDGADATSITYTGYTPANPAKNGTSYVNGLISKTGADSKA
ncbi:hypothetical protein CCZ01_09900, partial [Helicobacter monodelphidis]|uniref:hypothetical protein n=1 Tax=Helicobacter sp. 15-1451 TaxID=2004995 RepID=UPI000DCC43A0